MSDAAPAKGSGGRRVAVVTDTTTYVPCDVLDRLGVRRVDLYVGWECELYRESSYADLGAFYARLRDTPALPRTSQPSVGDFLAAYRPLVAAGSDVASIHIAEGLSGTCASAREAAALLAAENQPGTVAVIDGRTGAGGLGLLVVGAAELAQQGADLDAVRRCVAETRERLEIYFCLDTLEYLRRGGRIGAAQAMIGTAIQVKPILTFGTEIAPVARVRTRGRAFERMVDYLRELRERGATRWIVQQIQAETATARMIERGREIFGSEPLFSSEVGPVLGAHLGAGMLVGGLAAQPAAG